MSNDELSTASGMICEINHSIRLNPTLKSSKIYRTCQNLSANIYQKRMFRTYDHAIYKNPNSGSVHWHQDQAYKYTIKKMDNIICWIPLQDTDIKHGCMRYISLKEINKLVSHNTNNTSKTLEAEIPEDVSITSCETNVGDMILHLPLTLHSSFPNNSDEVRKAWILHFGPYGRFEAFKLSNLMHLSKYAATKYFGI